MRCKGGGDYGCQVAAKSATIYRCAPFIPRFLFHVFFLCVMVHVPDCPSWDQLSLISSSVISGMTTFHSLSFISISNINIRTLQFIIFPPARRPHFNILNQIIKKLNASFETCTFIFSLGSRNVWFAQAGLRSASSSVLLIK